MVTRQSASNTSHFCEAAPWVKHLRLFVLVVLRQHVALSFADAAVLGAAPAAEPRGAGV